MIKKKAVLHQQIKNLFGSIQSITKIDTKELKVRKMIISKI